MLIHEDRKAGDDLADSEIGSQADAQYAVQLPRSARSIFCLIELSQDRLNASQEVGAGMASVSVTARVVRTKSATPISRSSAAMVRDAVD